MLWLCGGVLSGGAALRGPDAQGVTGPGPLSHFAAAGQHLARLGGGGHAGRGPGSRSRVLCGVSHMDHLPKP